MSTFLLDLRYGVRMLAKAPHVTAMVIVTLAVAIGSSAAIFSLMNALLLRPLPGVGDPGDIVIIGRTTHRQGFYYTSYPDFRDLRDQNTVFSDVAAESQNDFSISAGAWTQRISGAVVTPNYFRALGVTMSRGRGFVDGSDDFGGSCAASVVIGYGLWHRRFGGAGDVLGKTITVNGQPATIVGATSRGFIGTDPSTNMEAWLPFGTAKRIMQPMGFDLLASRTSAWLMLYGRLKHGISLEQANAEVQTIAARGRNLPDAGKNKADEQGWALVRGVGVKPDERHSVRQLTGILMGVVGLLLLLACANVANLSLAGATARKREIAVRAAIGAGRAQIMRQVVTESLLLASLGGIGGVALSFWVTAMLSRLFTNTSPYSFVLNVSPDLRVLAFTAVLTGAVGVLSGMAPALHLSHGDLIGSLKDAMSAAPRTSPLRSLLVSVQLMLSLVLLVGTGLLLRTVQKFNGIPVGFNPHDMVLMNVEPSLTGKYDAALLQTFYNQLLQRLERQPDVQQVTISRLPPLSAIGWHVGMSLRENPAEKAMLDFNTVAPNYFEVIGVPIVRGRGFTFHDTDASPPVVVVDETAAKTFWPGEDPVGKLIRLSVETKARQVIGVASDMKNGALLSAPRPYAYFSMWQPYPWPNVPAVIQIRTRTPLAQIASRVLQQVQSLDLDVPVFHERTIAEQIAISYWRQGTLGILIGAYAVVALLLAVVGVYGLMSYAVSQRTRELGIRMALGASPRVVLTGIVSEGGKIAVVGVTAGVTVSLALTRFFGAVRNLANATN